MTNAAETTCDERLGDDQDQQRVLAADRDGGDLADDGDRERRAPRSAMLTTITVSSAMPRVRQNCRRVRRKPRAIGAEDPDALEHQRGTGR